MIAEMYLKKRYQDGRKEREAIWRAWYEANREHLKGVTPPPFDEPPPQMPEMKD